MMEKLLASTLIAVDNLWPLFWPIAQAAAMDITFCELQKQGQQDPKE